MQPTDWGQALSIVGGGLLAVFFIMTLLALATSLMGRIFTRIEAKKRAARKAAEGEAQA
ncbi:MAG: OadG family transporter subunit [Thermodesulfobacteriota bacterium]